MDDVGLKTMETCVELNLCRGKSTKYFAPSLAHEKPPLVLKQHSRRRRRWWKNNNNNNNNNKEEKDDNSILLFCLHKAIPALAKLRMWSIRTEK